MPTSAFEAIRQDELALSVAYAVVIANAAAATQGVAVERSLVTITEQMTPAGRCWHVHYGTRDYTSTAAEATSPWRWMRKVPFDRSSGGSSSGERITADPYSKRE